MRVQILHKRLLDAARRDGFQTTYYAKIMDLGLPIFTRKSESPSAPHLYLSSGIHGDEPAGPLAILELLRTHALSKDCDWTIVPLINPRALQAKTRETPEGIDVNRDFGTDPKSEEAKHLQTIFGSSQFDLAICLHEDYEGEGFYFYQHDLRDPAISYGKALLSAAEPFCGIDQRTDIDGFQAASGEVFPTQEDLAKMGDFIPESVYLFQGRTLVSYTLESPSCANITSRIAAHRAAVLALIEAFLKT